MKYVGKCAYTKTRYYSKIISKTPENKKTVKTYHNFTACAEYYNNK